MLSDAGKLYLAKIGEALTEHVPGFDQAIAAAAWSPDGSHIALGSDSADVHVEHFASHRGFTIELTSEVCGMNCPYARANFELMCPQLELLSCN